MPPAASTVPETLSQIQEGIEQLGHDAQGRDIESAVNTLRHVPDAAWDAQSRKGCMVGTRVKVLSGLLSWSEDSEQSNLCWLTGMAGMGKSAIAMSFCQELQARKRLGGSFFCSKSSTAGDARRIIPTLAYLLARRVDEYKLALVGQVRDDPDVIDRPISVQFERLLQEPLSGLALLDTQPYVLVVDGIDECVDREAAVDLINSLITFAPLPALKVLLTSRPEDYLRRDTLLASGERNRILRLHDLHKEEVNLDIALYFHVNLKQIQRLNSVVNDALVTRLVDLTNGLFIFASTAVAYVRDRNPVERLKWLTGLDKLSPISTKRLDAMYKLILDQAANPENMEPQELDNLRDILAVVLALRSRLSVSALSELLEKSPEDLRDILDRLHAVVNVPDGDSEPGLNILHATFEDFLSDQKRAPSHFFIDTSVGHAKLALGCLTIIRSHVPTATSSYFASPVSIGLPSPGSNALMYASLQWSHHHAQAPALPYAPETEEAVLCISEAFYTHFKSSGWIHVDYLDCAIASQQGAVDRTHENYSEMPSRLNELGNLFLARVGRMGIATDLEAALEAYRHADELTPAHHPFKHICLGNIGRALEGRFERTGNIKDAEAAIRAFHRADELTPVDHPYKCIRLSDMGDVMLTRFERLGNIVDLEAAVKVYRRVEELTPDDHPDKHVRLSNIGRAMQARFERLGTLTDLDAAIEAYHRADELTPDNYPDKHIRLRHIGRALQARFRRLGNIIDIEATMKVYRRSDELTPDDHPNKCACLSDIGNAMQARFERFGNIADLEAAVESYRRATELTPDNHPDKAICFSSMGHAMEARFRRLGNIIDLEAGLEAYRRADELTPDDHPSKRIRLSDIGDAIQTRFESLGNTTDLEAAVEAHRRADELTPDDHPDKPVCLSSMGQALEARFRRLGNIADLEAGIAAYYRGYELTPFNHPNTRVHLSYIGRATLARFRCLGNIADLETAIKAYRRADELTPEDHPSKCIRLSDIGSVMHACFQRLGNVADLKASVEAYRRANELMPDDHSEKHTSLSNLRHAMDLCSKHLGNITDIKAAVEPDRRVDELTPDDHPSKHTRLRNTRDATQAHSRRPGHHKHIDEPES